MGRVELLFGEMASVARPRWGRSGPDYTLPVRMQSGGRSAAGRRMARWRWAVMRGRMGARANVRRGVMIGMASGIGAVVAGGRFWQVAVFVLAAGVSGWFGGAWAEAGLMGGDVGAGGN
jgi:hypothetical protein